MTITSLGLGSGLDAESIISSLMSVEKKPLVALQAQEKGIKSRMSSFGQIQSLFSDLQSAARNLGSVALWKQTKATSSDSASVDVTASSGAATGSYTVQVNHLAVAQTATSRVFPGTNAKLNAGSLSIQLGEWVGGQPPSSFNRKSGAEPVAIKINADDSLARIRDKVNGANAGVTASIINDASGARLSFVSRETGLENGFRITATEDQDDGDAGTGLSALAYDPLDSASQMRLNQSARNASATLNGIEISSASNTLAEVTGGMTLTLLKATSSAVTVALSPDTDAVKSGVESFVKAFNALASYIRTQTKYDSGTKVAGQLQGDRTVIGLQNQLRAVLNQASSASSMYGRLSDIGIAMKSDGTLETKAGKLSAAMASADNLAEMRKLFATETNDSASSGFMARFRKLADAVMGADGALTTATQGLSDRAKGLSKRQDAMSDRLAATEARLRQQYQSLDGQMAKLGNLSNYVGTQLKTLY